MVRHQARDVRKVVYFGSVQESNETAPVRILFTHIPDLELEQDSRASSTLPENHTCR